MKGYTAKESARLEAIQSYAREHPRAAECCGPYFLHKNGSVMCTGRCRTRNLLGPGQRFMEWNHASAPRLKCRPSKTSGRRCERCRT